MKQNTGYTVVKTSKTFGTASKKLPFPKVVEMKKGKWAGVAYLKVPLFGTTIYLSHNKETMVKTAEFFSLPPEQYDDDGCAGFTLRLENKYHGQNAVWVHVAEDENNVQVLSHEVCHATFFVCDIIGIENHDGPREPFCYIQDNVLAAFSDYLENLPEPEKPEPDNTEGDKK